MNYSGFNASGFNGGTTNAVDAVLRLGVAISTLLGASLVADAKLQVVDPLASTYTVDSRLLAIPSLTGGFETTPEINTMTSAKSFIEINLPARRRKRPG